jgi:pimeloyl-ACP methyl ester carboxylesterase
MKTLSALLICLLLSPLCCRATAVTPIDLDAFDAGMKTALLPNGVSLAYADRGPRDGIPVVLIHGFTNNARNWTPLLPYLDPRFRLIIVDARGHGRSSRPECCYTRLDMAYDVKLLLDQLHVPAAHIVGHSMGSIITQMFAENWPERTRRVVLIGSSGGSRASCGAPTSPLGGMREALLHMKDPIDPNSAFMNGWYGNAMAPEPEVTRRQRRDAAAIPVRVWLAVIDQGLTGMDLQSGLSRLNAPTLLMWGDKDTLITEPARCALREALPSAKVHVFPTYGHNPFWDDPAAVAAVLNPFLLEGP